MLVARVEQGVEEGLLAVLRIEDRHAGETSQKRDVALS
jgi:hypothetical protein